MTFPLPDFGDDDEQDIKGGSPAISGLPDENPFVGRSRFSFNHPTSRNLMYDSTPIYSTSSCRVFIARNSIEPPTFYALKSSMFVRRIRYEFDFYQKIGSHPTIISCYDMWIQTGCAFLQLELAPLGSIRRELFQFNNDQIWMIFSHIVYALSKIHSSGYMHLDISPSNILHCQRDAKMASIVNGCSVRSSVFKLADFGTALQFGAFDEDCEGAGPYVSPEALAYPHTEFKVGAPTDIFSLGVVMMELVTKKLAPRENRNYENLRNGTFDLSIIPKEFDFVAKMLNPNPEKRPTAEQLLNIKRVSQEIKKLTSSKGKGKIISGNTDLKAVTPVVPTNKLPPETPYSSKYSVKRKIIFDDDEL